MKAAPSPSDGSLQFWLMKSEPGVYSIDDLARDGHTMWEGVRNYQARNFMRDKMRQGDLVLFYHSRTSPVGVAGLGRVCSEAYPDPTQFDPKSLYFDKKSERDNPRWQLVDIAFVETFEQVVPLATLRTEAQLADMPLLRKGMRLSIQPVQPAEMAHVLAMAGAKTSLVGPP